MSKQPSVLAKTSSPLWLTTALCCFLFSCASNEEAGIIKGKKPFFDLETYFESEVERLNAASPFLEKTVTYNGNTETKSSSDNDFEKELQLFAEADINRPAWTDKYHIDSLTRLENTHQLIYTAMDSSLQIRKITIDYEQGMVTKMDIYKKQQSFVSRSNQHLHYAPEEGYRIKSFQKTIWSTPNNLSINVDFR